jgi:hypothetical protein
MLLRQRNPLVEPCGVTLVGMHHVRRTMAAAHKCHEFAGRQSRPAARVPVGSGG